MNLFLIDVDNTLYPETLGVFGFIDEKINEYMKIKLNMADGEIKNKRIYYRKQYGTTMAGLIRHYKIDPYYFFEYVHDIDVYSLIKPNPKLLEKIDKIKAVKVAFTNAPKHHAVKVLDALGIIDRFVDIFDIISSDFVGKPNRYPYEKILDMTKASSYMMADDWEVNLKTAKEFNMFTILIGKTESDAADIAVERFESIPLDKVNLQTV